MVLNDFRKIMYVKQMMRDSMRYMRRELKIIFVMQVGTSMANKLMIYLNQIKLEVNLKVKINFVVDIRGKRFVAPVFVQVKSVTILNKMSRNNFFSHKFTFSILSW